MRTPTTPGPHPGWVHRRCKTKLLDADKALFEYECTNCGHVFKHVFLVGPRGQRRPASAEACRLMARVWKGYGRCNSYCPKCSKLKPRPGARR